MKSGNEALAERLRNTTAVIMERVEDALAKVLANIADVNTKPDAVREIALKLKIKPTNDRGAAAVEVSCAPKLAAVSPFPVMLYLGKDRDGRLSAFERIPNQTSIFDGIDPDTGEVLEGKITPMPERKIG